MADQEDQVPLHGEILEPLSGSTPREKAPDAGERITVTVVVRSRADRGAIAGALEKLRKLLPHERPPILPPDEFERQYGAAPEDLAAVVAFAALRGLHVEGVSAVRCTVELSGTLEQFGRAFGVGFRLFGHPLGAYRLHDGPILIPRPLQGVIEDVIGLDDRPLLTPAVVASAGSSAPGVDKLVYTDPRAIMKYYDFPAGTGAGQCAALVQFGGGYNPEDMGAYFQLRDIPCPVIALVEVMGQTNQPASAEVMKGCASYLGLLGPADPNGKDVYKANSTAFWATLECTMDLQILGTVAPGARLVTYLAPNTVQGKYNAFSQAIFDTTNNPTVINCSWGSCENQTPQSAMISLDQLFQKAALKGVTICASAGDYGDGSAQCGQPAGHFPASSPNALACGGSSVAQDLSQETSWYEVLSGFPMSGGGGYSQLFDLPDWQKSAVTGQTGRGFPDVVAKADIMTGYDVLVSGLDLPMGGTSAAAPLWAGLIALLNEALKRPVGYLTSLLYSAEFASALRAIAKSGGGPCVPTAGWNPCTGLGAPVGSALLAALSAETKAAG
ncbi:MAG: S8 family serine peptidase [Thermoanaerobaculia bacterium]